MFLYNENNITKQYTAINNDFKTCHIQIDLLKVTSLKIKLIYLHKNNMLFKSSNYKKLRTHFHYEEFEQAIQIKIHVFKSMNI